MTAASSGPRPVGASLDRLLGLLRVPSTGLLDTVFGRWDEVVGADLARHVRPVSIDGDELVVVATDAAWASEVRWLEGEVLARLAEVSGSDRIRRVSVRVGTV